MSKFLRSLLPSILAGAVIGFVVLGVGGRLVMRIIAHWEQRIPAFSLSGSLEVVMMGTIAGVIAGAIHGLLRRFVTNDALRITLFIGFCVAFTLFGVKDILPRPKMLFVAITLIYAVILETRTRGATATTGLRSQELRSPGTRSGTGSAET